MTTEPVVRWAVVYNDEPGGPLFDDKEDAVSAIEELYSTFVGIARNEKRDIAKDWCVNNFGNSWRVAKFELREIPTGEEGE